MGYIRSSVYQQAGNPSKFRADPRERQRYVVLVYLLMEKIMLQLWVGR